MAIKYYDSLNVTGTTDSYFLGKVGIGIATPNTKLQISGGGFTMFAAGGANADQFLVTTHRYSFSDENEDEVYTYDSVDGHQFFTGGSLQAKILQDGNVEVYNNVTADAFIKDGGTSTQYLMADGSISTSSGGSSPWSTDTHGITYTAGTVGIGMASVANIDLSVDGPAKFDDAVRIVGNTRMDGTLFVDNIVGISLDTTFYADVIVKEDLRLGRDIYDKQELTGTSGQVLVSKGVGNGVEWETPSGGGGAQLLSYNFSAAHSSNDTTKYYQFRNQSNSSMYQRAVTFSNWGGVYYVDLVAPDDCFLKSFTIKSRNGSTWSSGLQIKMRIHKNVSTREYDGSFVTSTGSGNDGKITFDLTSSDTSFSQGDAIGIGFNCTGAMGYVTAMAIFELT